MLYQIVVYVHVVAAFAFVMAHGTSMAVAFLIPKENRPERLEPLLNASGSTIGLMFLSLLLLLIAGVAAGFLGQWWGQGWIWASIALMLVMTGYMFWYSGKYYRPLRKIAGLPYREGNSDMEAEPPGTEEEIAAAAVATNPTRVAVIGYGVLLIIVALMTIKPF